jgi:hypothetical protein
MSVIEIALLSAVVALGLFVWALIKEVEWQQGQISYLEGALYKALRDE